VKLRLKETCFCFSKESDKEKRSLFMVWVSGRKFDDKEKPTNMFGILQSHKKREKKKKIIF